MEISKVLMPLRALGVFGPSSGRTIITRPLVLMPLRALGVFGPVNTAPAASSTATSLNALAGIGGFWTGE